LCMRTISLSIKMKKETRRRNNEMESSTEKLYCYKFTLTEHCDIMLALDEWLDAYGRHEMYDRVKIIVDNMRSNDNKQIQ